MSGDWYGYRVLAWLIALVLLGGAVFAAVRGGWTDALLPGGFLVVLAVYLLAQRWLPDLFDLLLAAALLVNAAGWTWNLYTRVWGYDEAAHAFTTLALALVLSYLGYRPLLGSFRSHPLQLALAVFTLGLAVGVVWEVLEWAGYKFFTQTQGQVLEDEIMDLILDGLGALLAIPLALWCLPERSDRVGS